VAGTWYGNLYRRTARAIQELSLGLDNHRYRQTVMNLRRAAVTRETVFRQVGDGWVGGLGGWGDGALPSMV